METKSQKKISDRTVKIILVAYGIIVLTLILLSAANYPVQWRDQVNKERYRYLEVIAQGIEYHVLDHEGLTFEIPAEPSMIANRSECTVECPALGKELPCYNLEAILVPNYMKNLPQDPLAISDTSSGFYIYSAEGTYTLGACHHFFKKSIELSSVVPQ